MDITIDGVNVCMDTFIDGMNVCMQLLTVYMLKMNISMQCLTAYMYTIKHTIIELINKEMIIMTE